jgi:excisionase family DNA binding protein
MRELEETATDTALRERLLVRIPVAARMIDVSRAKGYQMAASGELPGVVHVGRSVRVSVQALREWIHQQVGAVTTRK